VLVVVTQRCQQVREVVVEEPVVRVTAVAPHGHQPQLAQEPQLVRHRALLHADRGRELLDGALAVAQRPQQAQPAGRSEGAHRLGEARRLLRAQRPGGVAVLSRMGHRGSCGSTARSHAG
jgi:hypothetical protein